MKTRYKKSEDIRSLLLDTAEALFAERGYFGVSVRDITDAAGVRNASINYHFGTKENLFVAVIDRRIEPLAKARLERLASVTPNAEEPLTSARSIADAFAGPMLDFAANGGPGWKNYCVLVAHLAVQKFWSANEVSAKYDSNAAQFIEALNQTFPGAEPYRIHCCFQFLLSTTLYAVCDNKRIDTLSEAEFRSDDLARLKQPMLDFIANGIVGTALAGHSI